MLKPRRKKKSIVNNESIFCIILKPRNRMTLSSQSLPLWFGALELNNPLLAKNKPGACNTGLANMRRYMMLSASLSSWEIMPHTILVCTGDIHVDGVLAAVLVIAWYLTTTRR